MASTRENVPVNFYDLPAEMVRLICYHLLLTDVDAIDALILASPHFKRMILEGDDAVAFWKNKLDLHFPHTFVENNKSAMQLKRALVKRYQSQIEYVEEDGYLTRLLKNKEVGKYLKNFLNTKRWVSLCAAAKEGDIGILESIIKGMENAIKAQVDDAVLRAKMINQAKVDILWPLLRHQDNFGFNPLFYARKNNRQSWLNYCYKQMPEDFVDQLTAMIAMLQPMDDIRKGYMLREQRILFAAECGHLEIVASHMPSKLNPLDFLDFISRTMHSKKIDLIKFLLGKIECVDWETREFERLDSLDAVLLYNSYQPKILAERVFSYALDTNNLDIVKLVLKSQSQYLALNESMAKAALMHIANDPSLRCSKLINYFLDLASFDSEVMRNFICGSWKFKKKVNVAFIRECMSRYPDIFDDKLCVDLLTGYFSVKSNNDFLAVYELACIFKNVWHQEKEQLLILAMNNDFNFCTLKAMMGNEADAALPAHSYSLFTVIANKAYIFNNLVNHLQLFKRQGADINKVDFSSGLSPLAQALAKGYIEAAKNFILLGATVDSLVGDGYRVALGDKRYPDAQSLLFRLKAGDSDAKKLCNFYLDTQVNDNAKRELLKSLLGYMNNRDASPYEYLTHFFCIPFGCSKNEKLAAADALLRVLLKGDGDLSLLESHQAALNQGRLGKFYNSPEVQHYLKPGVTEYDYVLPNFS